MNSPDTTRSNRHSPVISIVIPVYGTERFLGKCLDTVVQQTYRNLEIILVNDCTPDNSELVIQEYMSRDTRIRYVKNQSNKGLFHSRLVGADTASGDYIAFLDSDDYLGLDTYRVLLRAAENDNADIACCNMVLHHAETDYKCIHPLNRTKNLVFAGKELINNYFEQEGLSFYWHTVWNKIYTMSCWRKARPHYDKLTKHLIMAEDFVFSTVLFFYANRFTSVDYDGVFYLQNTDASTSLSGNAAKYSKNIGDLETAFEFAQNFLLDVKQYETHEQKFTAWKLRYSRFWHSNIQNSNLSPSDRVKTHNQLRRSFGVDETAPSVPGDHFIYSFNTVWDDRYERLKAEIASGEYDYVSFDIFDTLITRPFMKPSDLFVLLNEEYRRLSDSKAFIDFSAIREDAERTVRIQSRILQPQFEDITIDEIYAYIIDKYHVDPSIAEHLKSMEMDLELRFCEARMSAREVFDMALDIGCGIILVSDMYLPRRLVEQLLSKNEIRGYKKLYLSSDTRLSKHFGGVYDFILEDISCQPQRLLHIGDNRESDVKVPESKGIKTYFYPKAIDRMFDLLPDQQDGSSTLLFFRSAGKWINFEYATRFFLLRCMLATVANEYFDNPFRSFAEDSDFNGDPYFIGYYALGLHMFGVAKWLLENTNRGKYDCLQFVARDGYLPMLAYDILKKAYPDPAKSNYLYLSRKALIPAIIEGVDDLYSLDQLIKITSFSAKSFTRLFLKTELSAVQVEILKEYGVLANKRFKDKQEYLAFVAALHQMEFDFSRNKGYQKLVKRYVDSEIQGTNAIFDIGYAATSQMIVTELGTHVDAYYIHTNDETSSAYANRLGFNVDTFYPFSPSMSGHVREFLLSQPSASCIGYLRENGQVLPVFEGGSDSYLERYVIGEIHRGTTRFMNDFTDRFQEFIPLFGVKNLEVSMPYELFLHSCTDHDRRLFSQCYFEDDVYWGKEAISLSKMWEQTAKYFKLRHVKDLASKEATNCTEAGSKYPFLENRNRFINLFFYLFYDRHELKRKIVERYQGNPRIIRTLILAKRQYVRLRNMVKKERGG